MESTARENGDDLRNEIEMVLTVSGTFSTIYYWARVCLNIYKLYCAYFHRLKYMIAIYIREIKNVFPNKNRKKILFIS